MVTGRQHLGTQKDPQGHVGVSGPQHGKPNRPPAYLQKVQKITPRCSSEEGCRCSNRSHLLDAKLKMKLKNNFTYTQAKRQKFNVGFLKDPKIQKDYQLTLTNTFQVLQELYDEETDLHTMWKGAKMP